MNEIVRVVGNEAVTDTVSIANGSGNQHKNVLELVRNYIGDLSEFGRVAFETRPFETAGGMQSMEVAILNEHQATLILTYMKNTERIRSFKKSLVKAFYAMAEQLRLQAFNLPTTFSEALYMLANTVEEKELAIKQRDEAIRTKALIGSSREASAMGKASAAVKKVRSLEDELGRGQLYKSARAIPWITEYLIPSKGMWVTLGKKLVLLSSEMGLIVRAIDDSKYGHVNTYHVDVIEQLRKRLDADWNMMGKYRKEAEAA